MCTDACNDGLGGVLTQEGHVIAYESRKLKFTKRIMQLMIWNQTVSSSGGRSHFGTAPLDM